MARHPVRPCRTRRGHATAVCASEHPKGQESINRCHDRKNDGRPLTSTPIRHVRILVDAPTGDVEPLVPRTPGIWERILHAMRAEPTVPTWRTPDLLKRLAESTEDQIHKCLYRLTRSGDLRRISHGGYQLLTVRLVP